MILRDRRVALLALGQAVNGIGSWAAFIAIWGWAAYRFDVGPSGTALLMLGWGGPPVLLAPLAGVVIDRVGPRRVAVAGDLGGALVALLMLTADDYPSLLVLAALHGVTKAFAMPAYDALPARLVEPGRLFETNAVLTAAHDLSIVVGPVLAALVISWWGIRAAFVVDALTYLVGAAVVAPLSLRPLAVERVRARAIDEIREGLRIVRSSPAARTLFALGFALWLSFGTFSVLEPLYVRDVLDAPVTTLALLQTVFGVGLVGTGLLLPRLRHHLDRTSALALVIVAAGVSAGLYGATSSVVIAFAGVFLWGVTAGLFGAPSRTLLLRSTPDEAHGRVMAGWRMVQQVGHVVPVAGAGLLAEVAGVQGVLFGVGVVVVLIGSGALLQRAEPVPHDAGDLVVATP